MERGCSCDMALETSAKTKNGQDALVSNVNFQFEFSQVARQAHHTPNDESESSVTENTLENHSTIGSAPLASETNKPVAGK